MAEAEAEAGAPSTGKDEKKVGGMMGMLLAGVVLVIVGVVIGWFVLKVLNVMGGGGEEDETRAVSETEGREKVENCTLLAVDGAEGVIVTNVSGTDGRRYVKVRVQMWVENDELEDVAKDTIHIILKAACEEYLRTVSKEELDKDSIYKTLRDGFTSTINRKLQNYLGIKDPDHILVRDVIVSDLMLQ